MSASRTLQRKLTADRNRRALPENRTAKKGSKRRRVIDISDTAPGSGDNVLFPQSYAGLGLVVDCHFTKGYRVR